MTDPDLEWIETFRPSANEIDFLTEKINEESRAQNISGDAYPFAILLRKTIRSDMGIIGKSISEGQSSSKSETEVRSSAQCPSSTSTSDPQHSVQDIGRVDHLTENVETESIVGGCNGSIIYGSIYTDQLWVNSQYRGRGIGRQLMEKVHDLGKRNKCRFATVGTMDFQGALPFYEKLGYKVEFKRGGYEKGGEMIYLKRTL